MYSLCDCHQWYVPGTWHGKGKCKWNIWFLGKGSELLEWEGQAQAAWQIGARLYPCSREQNLPLHFLTVGTNSWCLLTSWWHEVVAPAPARGGETLHKINWRLQTWHLSAEKLKRHCRGVWLSPRCGPFASGWRGGTRSPAHCAADALSCSNALLRACQSSSCHGPCMDADF